MNGMERNGMKERNERNGRNGKEKNGTKWNERIYIYIYILDVSGYFHSHLPGFGTLIHLSQGKLRLLLTTVIFILGQSVLHHLDGAFSREVVLTCSNQLDD